MKKLRKKLILVLTVGIMMMLFAGCSKNSEKTVVNFQLKIESNKGFDYISIKSKDFENDLRPMHDDIEVKSEYSSTMDLPEESNTKVTIEAVKDGKVVLTKEVEVDLSNGKSAIVKLVDTKDGGIDIEVQN